MSEKYKTYPEGTFFVTLTVVGWIDVFTRAEYADLVIDNLNYCIANKGLKVYAYVLMSNHLHMVAQSKTNLGFILRDFKSFTAKSILKQNVADLVRRTDLEEETILDVMRILKEEFDS